MPDDLKRKQWVWYSFVAWSTCALLACVVFVFISGRELGRIADSAVIPTSQEVPTGALVRSVVALILLASLVGMIWKRTRPLVTDLVPMLIAFAPVIWAWYELVQAIRAADTGAIAERLAFASIALVCAFVVVVFIAARVATLACTCGRQRAAGSVAKPGGVPPRLTDQ